MKHCFILGTRPEIIKLTSCIRYCEQHQLDFFIIHSNQHYSENMDAVFFSELALPQPRYHLHIHGGGHATMTGKMMIALEGILQQEKPDVIYVQGDTNTVLAGGLVAAKLGITVVHIEAGLRSHDRSMPEEINRICVDHLSEMLFVPTERQKQILLSENIGQEKIFVVGNTIVDAVLDVKHRINIPQQQQILERYGISSESYILVTLHRPSNVDDAETVCGILMALNELSRKYNKKICLPLHPRTRKNISKFQLESLLEGYIVLEPVSFVENIVLQMNAFFIATDSGGIQEEACILQKRTLILRENTERPETLEVGGAVLVGSSKDRILLGSENLMKKNIVWYNPFGDGKSAEHIFQAVLSR